jgi:hypothetical protein
MWLEPWGEDYGMSPSTELEVVALDGDDRFHFHVISEERSLKVYAEGNVTQIGVYQAGALVSCGHDRRRETW